MKKNKESLGVGRIWIIAVLLVLLAAALYFYYSSRNRIQENVPFDNAPAGSSVIMCDQSKLGALAAMETSESTIYGFFTVKNLASKPCRVSGNNFIQVNYDREKYKNIDVAQVGLPGSEVYTLAPGGAIYAMAYMPNSPKCASQPVQVEATFTYEPAEGKSLIFKDSQGKDKFNIQTCSGENEITYIDITNMSDQNPNAQ